MRKLILSYLFRGCGLLVMLAGVTASVHAAETEAEYQARLNKLNATISQITRELESVKGTRSELEKELQGSETKISDLNKKIAEIQEALAKEKKRLAALQTERAALEQKRNAQQQQAGRYIKAAYQLGQQSEIKLLLNQSNPTDVSRTLRYYDYFIQAHSKHIKSYLQTLNRLAEVEPQIITSKNQLEQSQQNLVKQQRALTQSQAQRKQTLVKLNKDISQKENSLASLKKDREQLQKLLDEMSDFLANLAPPGDSTPFRKRQGKLSWPTYGKLTASFGSRRNGGLNWDGVFITSKEGTPVKAIHGGHVVFSDYLRGHGMLLIIDHGNGYMSLYAHNQTLLKDTGEWVNAGDTVARVGNSGGLSEAGLYFEIRHQGKPINPARWCQGHVKTSARA